MAVNVTYPGVYIDEVPSAVRTIVGVPTAVAAFVGPALRGPVDKARHITSFADFERIYGGLSEASLMSYAIFHYYQNGGSEAEIVRVVAARKEPATVMLGDDVKLVAVSPGTAGNNIRVRVVHDPNDATVYTLSIKDGTNVLPDIQGIKTTAQPDDSASLKTKLTGSPLAVASDSKTDQRPPESRSAPAGVDPFADPAAGQPKTFVQAEGGNDGAAPATITLLPPPPPASTGGGGASGGGAGAGDTPPAVVLSATYPGAWGNKLRVRVDYEVGDVTDVSGNKISNDKLYNLTIRDTGTGAQESFRNIVADLNSPRRLDRMLESSELVTSVGPLDVLPGASPDVAPGIDPFDSTATPPPYVLADGGDDGPQIIETELQGVLAKKSGIYALLDTDIFTMLCIPQIDRDTDFTSGGVLTAALNLCVDRRAMLLVDPPSTWTTVDGPIDHLADLGLSGDSAKNAALYFPRIKLPNQAGQVLDWPPCGAIAGVWARTDTQRNVAKAPAGTDASLSGVVELTVKLTDLENGQLNPLGINCLRTFPLVGSVIWGARTLKGADRLADQWKYIPVRRTALFIEESLYRGTQWVVFEPNDEPLWAAIRLNVGAFMNSLFRQGMFQGRTPQEAYLVKCDKDNNPQNDIDRGIVNILVGFAPLKPAEFVLIHIQQISPALQV